MYLVNLYIDSTLDYLFNTEMYDRAIGGCCRSFIILRN